jgi:ribonuclease J
MDSYQRKVLDVFTEYCGNKSSLYKFDDLFELQGNKPYRIEKITNYLKDKGFLMPVRMNSSWLIEDMMKVFTDEAPWLIYSMWDGYAEENGKNTLENVVAIRQLFENRIFDGVKKGFHTSGHADIQTLQKVCETVKPSIGVIPIHKDAETHFISQDFRVFEEGKTIVDGIEIKM